MKLLEFSVKNYKQFKKKFCLDLSDVRDYKFNSDCVNKDSVKTAIIYGKNAVGKTNFGYALMDITCHLAYPEVNVIPLQSGCFINADSRTKFAAFEYLFEVDGYKVCYAYDKYDEFRLKSERLYIDGKQLFDFSFNSRPNYEELKKIEGLETLQWEQKDKNMSLITFMAFNSTLSAKHPVKQISDFARRMLWFRNVDTHNIYAGFSAQKEGILDYVIRQNLIEDLNSFLRENGVDEEFVLVEMGNDKTLKFKHEQLLPASVASSGTRSLLLFYYWYQHFKEASFVFADEFDAFYHTELAKKIIALAKKSKTQMIFTSHNTNLMNTEIMRPDCYFIITKERIVSFANATKRELREGHNLERLYLTGEFDG